MHDQKKYLYGYFRIIMVFKTYPIPRSIHYINLVLWITFQCCGFVWKNEITTVPQLEFILFQESQSIVANLTHPLIILGLFGQIMLLVHAFRRRWNRTLNTIVVGVLALIIGFLAVVGCLAKEWIMVGMQLPFLLSVCIYFFFAYKKTEGEVLR